MVYEGFTTDYDLMNEELIQGAELTDYWNFPIINPYHGEIRKTVSFKESFKKKFNEHEVSNLNFFEDDCFFNQIWNSPFRYLDHLKKFQSVCMPDFSKAEEAPLAISLWNNYRNMALARWMTNNGIKVVPSISTLPESCWEWCFDGFPKHSVYCCSTNGFLKDEYKHEYFIKAFHEAEKRLEPEFVYIIGRKVIDLEPDCGIIYLNNCSMNNEKLIKGMNLYTPKRIVKIVNKQQN